MVRTELRSIGVQVIRPARFPGISTSDTRPSSRSLAEVYVEEIPSREIEADTPHPSFQSLEPELKRLLIVPSIRQLPIASASETTLTIQEEFEYGFVTNLFPLVRKPTLYVQESLSGEIEDLTKDNAPNIDAGVARFAYSHENRARISNFTALHLAKGDLVNSSGEPYSGIEELRRDIGKFDLGIETSAIALMLTDFAGEGRFEALVAAGEAKPEDREAIYSNISKWMAQLALDISFNESKIPSATTSLYSGFDYDFRYLPFLISSMNEYYAAIPGFVKPGQAFPIHLAIEQSGKLKKRVEQIFAKRIRKGVSKENKKIIQDVLIGVNEELLGLNHTQRELYSSGNWNRRREWISSYSEVPTFAQIRELIRSYGGRAPRHLSFSRSFAIRKGRD